MRLLRSSSIYLFHRAIARDAARSFHTSGPSSSETPVPNKPLELDPAFQALLKDVDMSLTRSTTTSRKARKGKKGYVTSEHRELEVLETFPDVEDTSKVKTEDLDDIFPKSERQSPAASFGSRHLGAVVLPFELQRSIMGLISESDKPLIHFDAKRLFQQSPTADASADKHGTTPNTWSLHYVPPSYTETKSTDKLSHIRARKNRIRDGTAFATVVMPAQYSVIRSVLEHVRTRLGDEWASNVDGVIDWGSGTGSGLWAALHTFRNKHPKVSLSEQSEDPPLDAVEEASYETADAAEREALDAIEELESKVEDAQVVAEEAKEQVMDAKDAAEKAKEVARTRQEVGAEDAEEAAKAAEAAEAALRIAVDESVEAVEAVEEAVNALQAAEKSLRGETGVTPHEAEFADNLRSSIAHNKGDDIRLEDSTITSYIALERRDGLSSIARRLLKDIPSNTTVNFNKYLHNEDRVSKGSETGQRTIALSAFLLNTITSGYARKDLLKEIWYSGADVIVIIEDASVQGYQNVADARDYLLKLGRRERWAALNDDVEAEVIAKKELNENDVDAEVEEVIGSPVIPEDFPFSVEGLEEENAPYATTVDDIDGSGLSGKELEEALRLEAYSWPRINFAPMKRSGHVIIDACVPEGPIMRLTYPRSQGKQIYHDARKASWGDIFPHEPKNAPLVRYTGAKAKGPAQQSGYNPIPTLSKEDQEEEKLMMKVLGKDEEKVKKAKRVLHAKKLGKGRGGEGALAKAADVSNKAGWSHAIEGLRKESRERREARKEAKWSKQTRDGE
ncbi:hypothetical protein M422DRAFT_33984 [Sphaerobolus stellatus SS14]|uniref:Unplaced genomic scaffold SPHSTscaffold_98, whole genome shotgun sequence n=1 Tax=Sphaerobolus stellatus (strain SS14) TaxID=990650 RepID=A0A0C9U2D2_SPHS4|nr:hypothetical protein M422DRAFT_33984 [Sphaerobolus stellatus SS14]